MGDLKPLGSEKLQGQEKINRILEISRYNEIRPSNVNETSRSEYKIHLVDGNRYEIVREKLGYIIKRTISESQTEYIEPMKNRKYYTSYSQALKRLNLLTKEVNRLNDNTLGTELFGEQKKFVLKTPKGAESEDIPAGPPPPSEPPAVPQPSLPPSPESTPPPPEDEISPTEDDDDISPSPSDDIESGEDEISPDSKEGGEVTFKMIQKLTGKLTQKIREFENEKGLTSENMKYVINMVLSSLDLNNLSDEDKEEIMMKFEGEDEDGDQSDEESMGGEDEDMSGEGPDLGGEETPEPMGAEAAEGYGALFDSIFGESKVDKVISKYFQVTESERKNKRNRIIEKNQMNKKRTKSIMSEVRKLSETIEQEWASEKFVHENTKFTFIGKTNKGNLVFESKNRQIKITPEGLIL